jgi:hypothetical protein
MLPGMKSLHSFALLAAALASTPVLAQSKAPPPGLALDLRLRSETVDDAAFARTRMRRRFASAPAGACRWAPGGAAWWRSSTPATSAPRTSTAARTGASGCRRSPTRTTPNSTRPGSPGRPVTPRRWPRAATAGVRQPALRRQCRLAPERQTFDALDAQHKTAGGWRLRYGYLDGVQRVFAGDHAVDANAHWDLDAHLVNVGHALGAGTFTGYAYWIGTGRCR